MYARVTAYAGTAEDFDRAQEQMESAIVPRVREMNGSAGILVMINRDTGQSLSITLWESEDAMAESRETANSIRSEASSAMGSKVTDVNESEVAVANLS
jgi:heme-degrading monooxygenase HmoA